MSRLPEHLRASFAKTFLLGCFLMAGLGFVATAAMQSAEQ